MANSSSFLDARMTTAHRFSNRGERCIPQNYVLNRCIYEIRLVLPNFDEDCTLHWSVVNSLVDRVKICMCSETNIRTELDHLRDTIAKKSYPMHHRAQVEDF